MELSDEEMAKLHQRFTQYLGTISLPDAGLRRLPPPGAHPLVAEVGLDARPAREGRRDLGLPLRARPAEPGHQGGAAPQRPDLVARGDPRDLRALHHPDLGPPGGGLRADAARDRGEGRAAQQPGGPGALRADLRAGLRGLEGRSRAREPALPRRRGQQFADEVRAEETTRRTLSEAEKPLRDLAETVRRLRRVANSLREHKEATGKPAETLATLTAKESQKQTWSLSESAAQDAWGKPFVLDTAGAEPVALSVGPDGAGRHGRRRERRPPRAARQRTAPWAGWPRPLMRWRTGSEPKAWPASLDDLLKPPPRAAGTGPALPPLPTLPTDGWGRPFVYQLEGGAGQAPELFSMRAGRSGGDGRRHRRRGRRDAHARRSGPRAGGLREAGPQGRLGARRRADAAQPGAGHLGGRSAGKDGEPGRRTTSSPATAARSRRTTRRPPCAPTSCSP